MAENGLEGMDPQEKESMMAIGDSQAGVVELSTLITNPGLKRAESTEVLNLTLHQCARDGNADNMKRLLQSLHGNVKKKVQVHDDEDLSPLHYAARYNHVHIVQMLVSYGANVNDTDEEGGTPLHFAARYKRMRLRIQEGNDSDASLVNVASEEETAAASIPATFFGVNIISQEGDEDASPVMPESNVDNSVIIYLVSQGADVNARDIYGCTPLHFAAMRGNEVATKELLSCKGVNVEAVDKQQMTALHMGASHDEAEICHMLIDAGAKLRCCDEDDATPLHYACAEGSIEIVQMLLEAGEKQDGWVTVSQMVTDQDNQQNSALHYAVENRSYDVAKICIEKGADVNTCRNNYSTPLHLAATAGDVKIVELLLSHNARIDALDVNQSTPLHKAAGFNHANVVEFLLEGGAKIDKFDKDNFSPLLIAACNGHAETIKTLLSRGANIYAVDKNDKTPLYWTAEEDKQEALKVLLEHPGMIDLIDSSDRYDNTPLHIAAMKGFVGCVRALLDADADINFKNEEEKAPIHLAAASGKTQVVRELIKKNKMVINDEDEDSNTALHLACLAGHNKVVAALIDAGADIEARNCTLWTPLDCAAAKGWGKTVRVLLEADSPIDPMDKTKTTPLHLASSRGHVTVVNLLIKWHAHVAQTDHDGNNCLDLAVDNGHKDVALAIISSSKWKEAMRNETLDLKTGYRNTPMRKLIRKMPDVCEKVFQRCATANTTNSDDPKYTVTFNYEFLDDMYANWRDIDTMSDTLSSADSIYDEENKLVPDARPYSNDATVLKKNHPLMVMVNNEQEDLLVHPLVASLLRHKWNRFGRYFYYTNLFVYSVFLFFLTSYIVSTTPPYMYANYTVNATHGLCEIIAADPSVDISQSLFAQIGKYFIMALAGVNILREIFQIYNAKFQYLGWENLIEWVTYVSALLVVIDFSSCQSETGIRESWQWQLAAVCIFLAWIDLVLFFQKFPMFGIYIVMFTDICYTFVQFFPVFFLFIVAFALCFFVLLQNQVAFANVGWSLVKTSVMMIGEFEFESIFFDSDGDKPEKKPNYDGITVVLFVIFLALMSIIIMNLLVGLAVDDIKAVQEKAVLKRLAMQVELALDVESIVPQFFRRRFVVKCVQVQPNIRSRNPITRLFDFDSTFSSSGSIAKALNPDLDDMEILQENQDKMMSYISGLRFRMKNMEANQMQVQRMMTALLRHHNVDVDDEDVVVDEDPNANTTS